MTSWTLIVAWPVVLLAFLNTVSGYILPLLACTPLTLGVDSEAAQRSAKKWAYEEKQGVLKSQLLIWEPITLLDSVSSPVK